MSIKIIIETADYLPTVSVRTQLDQIDEALLALGLMRRPFVGLSGPKLPEAPRVVQPGSYAEQVIDQHVDQVAAIHEKLHAKQDALRTNPLADEMSKLENPADIKTGAEAPDANLGYMEGGQAPRRVPGQPSPGKRRRTAAEVAEDEAAAKGAPASNAAPLISTGEPRVDPAVVAQDEADEARETAANKTGLTLDDVRAAFGVYSKKVGLPKAIETIREILGSPIAEIPNTQEALGAAIAKIADAIDGAKPEGVPQTAAPAIATKQDCYDALMAYGKKYDGSAKPEEMIFAKQDITAILQKMFGAAVTGFTQKSGFPESPENYGRARAAFVEALNSNPFGRMVRA
jgi:hypothetical protein